MDIIVYHAWLSIMHGSYSVPYVVEWKHWLLSQQLMKEFGMDSILTGVEFQ